MADPLDPQFTAQNPIVAAATRIRARRELGTLIDAATGEMLGRKPEDADESLALFAAQLAIGVKRLNSILTSRGGAGVKLVRMEKPLRLRVRFGEKRVTIDLDAVQQLVRVMGLGLNGEYQFDLEAPGPALINLSLLSTDERYGERLTPSSLLKLIAQDAELPPPPHLSGPGPLSF